MMNTHNTLPQIPSEVIKTKEEFWNEHILLKRKSGLSRSFYCRKHKLNCDNFAYWEQKYTKAACASKLVPINLATSKSEPSTTSINIIPNSLPLLCALTIKNGNELKVYDKSVIPLLLSGLG